MRHLIGGMLLFVAASTCVNASGVVPRFPVQHLYAGGQPSQLLLGDLNGDGINELVVSDNFSESPTSETSPTIGVFSKQGGEYSHAAFFLAGPKQTNAILADLNGDGLQDIVQSASGSSSTLGRGIWVLLGDATTMIGSITHYRWSTVPSVVGAIDADGDGILDLIVAEKENGIPAALVVMKGLGDGSFAEAESLGITTLGAASVVDATGDREPDLLVTAGSQLIAYQIKDGMASDPEEIYPLTGNNQYGPIDLESDGTSEFIVRFRTFGPYHLIKRMEGGGYELLQEIDIMSSDGNPAAAVGDLDGDGLIDLFLSRAPSQSSPPGIWLLRGLGGNAFGSAEFLVTGDGPRGLIFDSDTVGGGSSVFVANSKIDAITVLQCNPDGVLKQPLQIPNAEAQSNVAVGDLNEDGFPDIVVQQQFDQGVRVYLTSGGPSWAMASTYAYFLTPSDVAILDVNLDGHLDIVSTDGDGTLYNSLGVRYGNGDGTFGEFSSVPTIGPVTDFQFVDLDHDGDLDLLAANFDYGYISACLNGGNGVWQFPPVKVSLVTHPSKIRVADFNLDGQVDFACLHRMSSYGPTDAIEIRFGISGTQFGPAISTALDVKGILDIDVGDVDQNGLPDIVLAVSNSYSYSPAVGFKNVFQPALIPNLGSGKFGELQPIDTEFWIQSLKLLDMTGDGILDIVGSSTSMSTLEGCGDGTFTPVEGHGSYLNIRDFDVADLDLDGDLDLAVVSSKPVYVYFNDSAALTPTADLNHDGVVDGSDLGLLLAVWGSDDSAADLNGDGIVDGADLGLLLAAWTG